jgi:hypothetical protein
MQRRDFVGLIGTAAGVLLAGAGPASADRVRVLPPIERTEDLPAGREKLPALKTFIDGVRVGELRAHGALAVFWLHASPLVTALDVLTFDEARARGDVVVSERPDAAVSVLVIDNRGKRHVLLLAGEIVVGGKQNRVVAEDVLLPPVSGPRQIAVYCVEQGRWAAAPKDFAAPGSLAAPKLRSELLARPPQQQVWNEVSRYAARAAAPSPTGSYQAVFDKPEVRAHQQQTARAIDGKMPPDTRGAAVFVGESFSGIDLFADATLFAREWPKLLRAHAIETYDRAPAEAVNDANLRARLKALLAGAATAEGGKRPTPGTGGLFEFRVERVRGTALVAEGQVVHAALL